MKKIVIIILCLLTFGCYNYQEIDSLGVVSTFGIDYQNNEFVIYAEIQKYNSEKEYSSYLTNGSGSSLQNAITNLTLKIGKEIYFNDIDLLLLSKNAINNQLDNITNFFTNDNRFTMDFNLIICDDIENSINIILKQEQVFGLFVKDMFAVSEGNLININFGNYLDNYFNKNKDLVIPYLEIDKDNIIIKTAIMFKGSKVATTMNQENIAIYNILSNYKMKYYFDLTCIEEKLSFQTNSFKTKYFYTNHTININISISGNYINTDPFEENIIKQCTKELSNIITKAVDNYINLNIINKSDTIGFNKLIYNHTRKSTKVFDELSYKIKIDINNASKNIAKNERK